MHKRRHTIPHWAAPKAVGLDHGSNGRQRSAGGLFWSNASTSQVHSQESTSSSRRMMTIHNKRNTIPHWAVGLWGLWRIMAATGDNDPLERNSGATPAPPQTFPQHCQLLHCQLGDDTFTQAQVDNFSSWSHKNRMRKGFWFYQPGLGSGVRGNGCEREMSLGHRDPAPTDSGQVSH